MCKYDFNLLTSKAKATKAAAALPLCLAVSQLLKSS